mmetsp:Transcript_51478/g.122420  ORF Transcript_51478/g.122420 Transcript_51478/m.122420 type:complete len:806 (-) Transcript_51478:24-2441(-)
MATAYTCRLEGISTFQAPGCKGWETSKVPELRQEGSVVQSVSCDDADEAGGTSVQTSPSTRLDGDATPDTPCMTPQAWFRQLLAEPYEMVYSEQSLVASATEVGRHSAISEGEEENEVDLTLSVRNLDTGETRDLREDYDPNFFGELQDPSLLADTGKSSSRPWKGWWKEQRQQNEKLWRAAETGRERDVLGVLEASCAGGGATATVNARALYGKTALHMASATGHADCVEALLQSSADVHARTDAGCTALHLACERGHLQVVHLLYEARCDIQAQTLLGETPLHLVSSKGHTEVLKFLLDHSTDEHLVVRNNYGQRPSEVSRDIRTFTVFDADSTSREAMSSSSRTSSSNDAEDRYAGRTPFHEGAVLLRNSRQDAVQRLLLRTGAESGFLACGCGDAAGGLGLPQELSKPSDGASSSRPRQSSRSFSKLRADSIEVVGPDSFMLKSMLGKGSFGEVYKVVHRKTGQAFAMKVLRKSKIFSRNLVRYAVTERNLLSYIKHPFIVRLHYAFQTPTCLAMVLQYCPGGNLAALIAQEGRVSEPLSRLYIAEVFLAIEYLHERKVVYRDMKPENVVLDDGSHAMLTDFGLSKEGVEGLRGTRSFCGSTAYLAPEVLAKAGHGPPVDLYGLGVLLHELLIGQPPYYSRDRKTLLRNIAEASLQVPQYVTSEATSFIQSMLHRNPAHRLGAQNTSDVRSHPLFSDTDWDAVLKRQVAVPLPGPPTRREPLATASGSCGKVPSPFEGRLEAQVRRMSSAQQDLSGWEFSTAASSASGSAEAVMTHAVSDSAVQQRWQGRPRKAMQAPIFF